MSDHPEQSPTDEDMMLKNAPSSTEIMTSTEAKPLLPPIKHLPLRKRLAMEGAMSGGGPLKKQFKAAAAAAAFASVTPKEESTSQSQSSSPIKEEFGSKKMQPLKKAYNWSSTQSKVAAVTSSANKLPTTTKMAFNNGGLPGNPLLWNNGDAEKYAPWMTTEETIDSFKSAWLDDSEDTQEEQVKAIKPVPIKKSSSQSKRGRPPIPKNASDSTSSKRIVDGLQLKRKNSLSAAKSNTDGKLYCLCRQPYDATRFMIACDRCDDWFHGECIGINEKESEFIDLYFCEKCSKITGKETSWKPKCANPACFKAARIGSNLGYLSKYCSDNCGMQVAKARLELAEMKRRSSSDGAQTATFTTSIAQLVLKKQTQLRIDSLADKQNKERLIQIKQQKYQIRDNVEIIDKKLKTLHKAIQSCDISVTLLNQDTKEDDMCGFDFRLILPDHAWKDQVEEEKLTTQVCQIQNCAKHSDWPKLILLKFNQERKEQFQRLSFLQTEANQTKSRMRKRRKEKETIRELVNRTIDGNNSSDACK